MKTIADFYSIIIHPDDLELVRNSMRDFENEHSNNIQLPIHRIVCRNGDIKFVKTRAIAFSDDTGNYTRMVGIIRDITRNKTLQDELVKSNERFELAARASYDAIWDIDVLSNQITFTEAIERLYGHVIKKPVSAIDFIRTLVHPDDQENLLKASKEFIKSKALQKEFPVHRIVRKNGTIAYVMVRVLAIRSPDNFVTRIIGVSRDITDNYLRDQEISASNTRFAMASKASFDVIWERDFITNKYLFSDSFKTVFGFDNDEDWTYDKVYNQLIHPDDRQMLGEIVSQSHARGQQIIHYPTFRCLKKNGESAYVQVHAMVTYDDHGNPLRTIGVIRDITQQYLLEKQLHKVNEQYQLVSKATSDVIWEWDYKTDTLSFCNEGIETLFGYNIHNRKTTMRWRFEKIHPADLKKNFLRLQKGFKNHQSVISVQYRFLDADNNYRHILDRAYVNYNEQGLPEKITGAMQDITAIKELQDQLAEEAVLHQQEITEVTIQTQEKEREEFGRELHDNINQILASIKLYIEMAIADSANSQPILQKSHENVLKVIHEIRMLSRALVSPVLDVGLPESIRNLIDHFTVPQGPVFRFLNGKEDLSSIPHALQLMLYRIVQEQVNNIFKYASAGNIVISLSLENEHLRLSIADDGVGFDINTQSFGLGLRNIKSRAKLYHGKATIASSPGNGCTLDVDIDLKKLGKPPGR